MSGVSTSGSTGYPIGDAIRMGVLDTYNIVTDIYSMYKQNELNKWQQSFAEQQFDYQKELNQTMMNREDTAVQRRVADLTAAGLNPNLAAGSAAGSQSMSAGGSAPSLKAPSSRGVPFQALIDLQQRKAQVDMLQNQAQLVRSQQAYYDALAGKVSEDTKNVSLKSEELLHNLGISKNLNLRTGDYGNSIVRDIMTALQYLSSPDARHKFESSMRWLKSAGLLSNDKTPDPGVRQAVESILQSSNVKEIQDFLEDLTENDVVSTVKRIGKSQVDNIVDSGSVLKELWRKFKESIRSAPKMLDNGLSPF